jgi:type II secretory pathway pseudopilin PulG
MDTSTWIWIIVAILVVLIIVGVIAAMAGKKRQESHRTRAGELREQAGAQATGVQQREADARGTSARAEQARAEADRLSAEARDKESTAAEYRENQADSLREADRLDPDVDTKSDDYVEPGSRTDTTSTTDEDYAADHRSDTTRDT